MHERWQPFNMKTLATILILLVGQITVSLGQSVSLENIDFEADKINANKNLTIKEFDASEVYGQTFDGGGLIRIHFDKDHIKKIGQEIGLSFGRVRTTIYFSQGKPIKIIDAEDNFELKPDQSTIDYTKLQEVFKATIYIFDWETDLNKTMIEGKRNLSEGTCSIFEYEGTIDIAKKLLKKK